MTQLTAPTERAAYVEAMANVATGVTVVSTDGPAGRYAQTVSAMCSVSADPPLLLVCVNRRSPLAAALDANGVLAVNVLAAHQHAVADSFAGRSSADGLIRPYDFACAEWTPGPATGAPALSDAAAVLDCTLVRTLDAGTHRIFLGAPAASRQGEAPPLTYHARVYGQHLPHAA